MATVTAALSINSADVLTSNLALTVNSVISCDSGSLIRAKVKGTTADTDDKLLYKANQKNDRAYLFIRNLETELENYIYVRNETESNTALVAKIGGGEFAFIPIDRDWETDRLCHFSD